MKQADRTALKAIVEPVRQALYNFDEGALRKAVETAFDPAATARLAFPFEDLDGPIGFLGQAIAPLSKAMPDLERRDTLVMAGETEQGENWVGCAGYYTGTFFNPFLDIPPTGHQASMRFHEFFQMTDDRVTDFQALWDIPELMMQANAWPMAPSLGREWHVPGPATQDGLMIANSDDEHAQRSFDLVQAMLENLGKFAEGGFEAMALEQFWHPHFSWYGPSGIGTGRSLKGFQNWHQIPFLNAMPNRVGTLGKGNLFADGDYVGFTAWPGMHATITGDGWMGIAPSGQEITMRSLDFWRCENGLIRENWVLVDLLSVFDQIGVDVLGRMREFNKARAR